VSDSRPSREAPTPPAADRRRRAWAVVAALAVLVAAEESAVRLVPLPARLSTPPSPIIVGVDGETLNVALADDDRWRVDADLDRIDPELVDALLAVEDQRFWWHPGVDPLAVTRAAVTNLWAGEVQSGASTLTMQVVRMAEPRPRTLRSKLVEAARAWQLERRWTKAEILEAWLTLAPFGGNVEGVETASLAWFGHRADALSADEIAVLLAVPQDPNGRAPGRGSDAALRAARHRVALDWGARGSVDTDLLARIDAAPLPGAPRAQPRLATHAAAWMRARDRALIVETTLDGGVQRLVERVLAADADARVARGIYNSAVVVVEHRTGAVRALAATPHGVSGHGADIPAFDVPRSPGSALKPLLFARAIDRGLALPEQVRADVPVRYGSYTPENYDRTYSGTVTLGDALARSLNVPFVELLAEVGVPTFLADLRAHGASRLSDAPGHYGLSAAVGGVELSPLELAGVYVALARGGRPVPVTWRPGELGADRPGVAPGTAFLTRRALSGRDRPDFPTRLDVADVPRRIHWKTGTSFGHRDAWAAGSGRRYTVVVWLGNLDRTPSAHLVGAEAAGPVLFDVLEGLDDGLPVEETPPDDLVTVELCAESGRLPTHACPRRRAALALGARVPVATCDQHVTIEVDAATGLRVGPGCRDGRDTRLENHTVLPPRVRRFYQDHHRATPELPGWAPGCAPATGVGPEIRAPVDGEVLLLVPGLDVGEQEVPLEADGEGVLTWFADGAWLGAAPATERVWWTPSPGSHTLVVQDDAGRVAHRVVVVRSSRPTP
jgi:penicillin-binding protein 1C